MKSEDEAFEAYLEGGTPLSRLYREATSATTPPEALDAAILEAGRAAGEKSTVRPLTPGRRRERRWVLPSALAASIALCIGWIATQPGPELGEPDRAVTSEIESSEVVQSEELAQGVRTPPATAPGTGEARAKGRSERAADLLEPRAGDVRPAGLEPTTAAPEETIRAAQPLDEASRRLAQIEALLGKGEQDVARVMFYAFRERFPDHPIPDDLLTRLGM